MSKKIQTRNKITYICSRCDKEFIDYKYYERKFCSYDCYIKFTPKERFWEKVDKKGKNGCWEWQGGKVRGGYGNFRYGGRTVRAHRYSWELNNGDIPEDDSGYGTKLILHKCDNRSCVNPNHLFLGEQVDNIQDAISKDRFNPVSGENHYLSKLTKEQVIKIRENYKGKYGEQTKIAKTYNVDQSLISRIINNKIWKNEKHK